MNCTKCNMEEKLLTCCMNHPMTEKFKMIEQDGKLVKMCPNLSEAGLCMIYEQRPKICREYDCLKISK